ncbi:MAG: ribonuclease Z [Bacteroidales bacterium]|nr:ribonuclease Z [Bacteroidales bacterium]
MSPFSVTMLGTASAVPFSDRNPSAQALSVHGRLYLLDCGEGTQQRIRQEHLSFVKFQAVFISHIHGDHIFGLYGLLSTMSLYHRTEPFVIVGPENLRPVLDFYRANLAGDQSYEVEFRPVSCTEPEEVYSDGDIHVFAFPLNHGMPCFGYRIEEEVGQRRFPWKPRTYAYCSDTAPFPELPKWVDGVDILYHEATYPQQYADKARQYLHSSTLDAAACALKAGVGKLLIGHYSSRVKDISVFENECRTVFADTVAANDGDIFEITR